MSEGQEAQGPFLIDEVHRGLGGQHIGHQVAMGEHGALGVPGGAGGVDEGKEIRGLSQVAPGADLRTAGLHASAFFLEGGPVDEGATGAFRQVPVQKHSHLQVG